MTYLVGQLIRLQVTFRDVDGDLANPTTVALTIQAPDNSQTIYTSSIIHDSIGLYHQDFTANLAGEYLWRWDGEGALVAIQEGNLIVEPTTLVPQPVVVAPAPEWTRADLLAVDAAIAQGAKEVRFADRTIVYNSTADLLMARTIIMGYLATAAGQQPRRQLRVFTNKGWSD